MALEQPGPAWLFCPGDRPERFEKASAAADVVILDLEDGVAAADRAAARATLVDVALGGTANRFADGTFRDVARHVRSQSLLAAKAHGRMALDSVYLDIKDLDGLRAEVDDAVAVGFDVKVAIHPGQVSVIRAGYAPLPDQVQWARHVLAAASDELGVFAFGGIMVDAPVLRRAEWIMQLTSDSALHTGSDSGLL